MTGFFECRGIDLPWNNFARESLYMDRVRLGETILSVWRNPPAVVVGRNQEARAECRIAELEAAGGILARRMSGGGAVYHDEGTLNFSFVTRGSGEDSKTHIDIVRESLKSVGIECRTAGRNDLVAAAGAEERKIAGTAYHSRNGSFLFHGCVLVSTDMEKLERYLSPSEAKLRKNAIASVRSRVANLTDLNPEIEVDALSRALEAAFASFCARSGGTVSPIDPLGEKLVHAEAERFSDPEWRYGSGILSIEEKNGRIVRSRLYTDAL